MCPFKVLDGWIYYTSQRGMRKKMLDFILLHEVLKGDVWSESFVDKKRAHIDRIIGELDPGKKEARAVIEAFNKRLGAKE